MIFFLSTVYLWFLLEQDRLRMNVALMTSVKRHIVTINSELSNIHEQSLGQSLPHHVHVPGALQSDSTTVTQLHQLLPHLSSELEVSRDQELFLTPASTLGTRVVSSPDIE